MKRTFPDFTRSSQRAQRFLDRRFRIGPVQLIEIDPIGVEPSQARFDRLHDVAARCAAQRAGGVHRQAEFGRQHDVLAPGAEELSQDFLGAALVAVDVGGVDQA